MSEPRLVVVTWQDPQQETGVPSTKPPKLYTWRTTGWLIEEDHDGLLVIATSLGEDGERDLLPSPDSGPRQEPGGLEALPAPEGDPTLGVGVRGREAATSMLDLDRLPANAPGVG